MYYQGRKLQPFSHHIISFSRGIAEDVLELIFFYFFYFFSLL